MAWTYAIDPRNNDMVVGRDGKLLKVYGVEEVRQRILITLQHHYQEYFLNVPAGMPWYQLLLGSKDIKLVETMCRRAILGVPGVISIIDLHVVFPTNQDRRDLTLYATVEVFGEVGPQTIQIVESILMQE